MTTQDYVSVQEKFVDGQGHRNIVRIQKGRQAVKIAETMGPRGEVLKRKTRKLTTKERKKILAGVFVPGLWRNCCVSPNAQTSQTRRYKRR